MAENDADVRRRERARLWNTVATGSLAVCLLLFILAIWTGSGQVGGTGAVLLAAPLVAKLTAWKASGGMEGFFNDW